MLYYKHSKRICLLVSIKYPLYKHVIDFLEKIWAYTCQLVHDLLSAWWCIHIKDLKCHRVSFMFLLLSKLDKLGYDYHY